MLKLLLVIPLWLAAYLLFYFLVYLIGLLGIHEVKVPKLLWWPIRLLIWPATSWSVDGVTAGYCSFISADVWNDAELRTHEGQHRVQSQRESDALKEKGVPNFLAYVVGPLVFAVKDAVETLRHGYWNNKYEVEAREVASKDVP